VRLKIVSKLKKCSDLIGNLTRDLRACSIIIIIIIIIIIVIRFLKLSELRADVSKIISRRANKANTCMRREAKTKQRMPSRE
jgi:hypothetical protein